MTPSETGEGPVICADNVQARHTRSVEVCKRRHCPSRLTSAGQINLERLSSHRFQQLSQSRLASRPADRLQAATVRRQKQRLHTSCKTGCAVSSKGGQSSSIKSGMAMSGGSSPWRANISTILASSPHAVVLRHRHRCLTCSMSAAVSLLRALNV